MSSKLEWISGLKFKALAWLVAIALATIATITLAGLPALPVVGVAVAAAAVSVAKLTTRLTRHVCLSCGQDLHDQPVAEHGIACPGCGSIRQPGLVELARMDHKHNPSDRA